DWLGPSGLRYRLTQRISTFPGLITIQTLEPGLPKPVLMIFEVSEDDVFGGTLLVSRSYLTPLDEEVRMPVTSAGVDDIRSAINLGRSDGGVPWTLEAE